MKYANAASRNRKMMVNCKIENILIVFTKLCAEKNSEPWDTYISMLCKYNYVAFNKHKHQ